jgi:hypothetical protein
LLAALVAARPEDEEVLRIVLKWVEDNPKHQQAYDLLAALVAARPADDEVLRIVLKWVEDNPKHQQAYQVLAALVAARPADEKVLRIVLKWVEDNPKHQQAYELLKALVAARADDEVLRIVLKWVEDNPKHQQAYQVLAALVAARPADEKVLGAARRWLNENPNHPHAYQLLSPLITRSGGAEEWMQKGRQFLASATDKGRRSLLAALLSGSKADKYYIKITLDAIGSEPNKAKRNYLLVSLGRALANNIENALHFLSGESTTEYHRIAAQVLARGLRSYPNRAQEFLELVDSAPANDVGLLLSACIASAVPGVSNGVLRRWLNDHQRARGYGTVLRTLKKYPNRWQELRDLGSLTLAVQLDYRRT